MCDSGGVAFDYRAHGAVFLVISLKNLLGERSLSLVF